MVNDGLETEAPEYLLGSFTFKVLLTPFSMVCHNTLMTFDDVEDRTVHAKVTAFPSLTVYESFSIVTLGKSTVKEKQNALLFKHHY